MINSGYFYALTATFFWSFNIIIASYFAETLKPWEIAFGRWVVAAVILGIAARKGLRESFSLLLKNWPLVLWLALTGIVLDNTLIYYAGQTASAVDMGLLDVTGPIFLVILSRIFFKTPISGKQIAGLAIAVFGVIVIILNGDLTQIAQFNFVSGDFWMLVNTFCFAVYSLLQSKRPAQISQTVMLAATAIVGVAIIAPVLAVTVSETQLLSLNMKEIEVMIYLGLFNSILSYLAWNTALNKIGNVKTGIIYYLLPIFSGIEAYYMLGEQINTAEVYGGILVIGGIALGSMQKHQKKTFAKKQPHIE